MGMTSIRFFLLASLLLSYGGLAHATTDMGENWEKTDEGDGITIYERKEGDLLAFRTAGEVKAPLRQVAGAILDFEHTTEWVDHLEEETILSRPASGQFTEYTHVSTPFVLKDRDFVCLVTVTVDRPEKLVTIESHSVEDAARPRTSFVRGKVVHNEFRLRPGSAPGTTHLEGEFHIDPMGSVPKWIVNMFQHAWPKKAFRAIEDRVAKVKTKIPAPLEDVLKPIDQF